MIDVGHLFRGPGSSVGGLGAGQKMLPQRPASFVVQAFQTHRTSIPASRGSLLRRYSSLTNPTPEHTTPYRTFLGNRNLNPKAQTNQRRYKSRKAQNASAVEVKEEPLIGDNPPLFDGKPPFWARWVFVLLGLDVLFVQVHLLLYTKNHAQ